MNYTCDECGKEFELGDDTILAPLEERDGIYYIIDGCDPFTPLTTWCSDCAGTKEIKE